MKNSLLIGPRVLFVLALTLTLSGMARAQNLGESLTADVVEFHIKPGTGSGSWNTLETPIVVRVGQILRFINDDSVPHQLHTFGSPCEHGRKAFQPTQSYDCAIVEAHSANAGDVYDHIYGNRAQVFIQAD